MKKYLIALITCSLLAGVSCQEKMDIEKEKEAIKAVMEEERSAFFDRDFSRYEATWIQEPTSRKYFMGESGITKLLGWSEVGESDKAQIENEELWENSKNLHAEYTNFEISVYENTALVFHDTQWSGIYRGEELDAVQVRIVHLVKLEGKWKIDLMAMYRIPDEGDTDDNDEDDDQDDDDDHQ
jgi:hypothetical protein